MSNTIDINDLVIKFSAVFFVIYNTVMLYLLLSGAIKMTYIIIFCLILTIIIMTVFIISSIDEPEIDDISILY